MAAISIIGFRGEVPRLSPHLLPNSCAQLAVNCKMLDGDAVPLTSAQRVQTFPAGPVKSIFWLANQVWLRWNAIVTVARSQILDDTTSRIYYTFDDGSGPPRVTNLALAKGVPVGDVSTDTFVIAAIGVNQNVPVNDYGFIPGQPIFISDGTNSLTGQVSAVPGTAYSTNGFQTIRVITTSTAFAGATMAKGATISVNPPISVMFPLASFKLGSPAPLNAPSVDYSYSQLQVVNLDPCNALSTAAVSDATTAAFVLVAVGSTQTVSISNGTQFTVGDEVYILGSGDNIAGRVTAIASNDLTVQTVQIIVGTAGDTIAIGAMVTVSAYTVVPPTSNGSVTLDTSFGNPASSFKLNNINAQDTPMYIYKDFQGGESPPSTLQFDFNIKYVQQPSAFTLVLEAITGASSGGTGNVAEINTATISLTTTTSNFVAAAVNSPQTFPVASAAGLSLGQSIVIDDTATAIQATITLIAGLSVTATTTVILAGTAGSTIVSGAFVGLASTFVTMTQQDSWAGLQYGADNIRFSGMLYNTWYCCQVIYLGEIAGGFNYRVRVLDGATRTTVQFTSDYTQTLGPKGTFAGWNTSTLQNVLGTAHIDNLGVQDFVPAASAVETEYVFTYVTQLGMESAPSPVSNVIVTSDALSKIVTLPPVPGTGETAAYGATFLSDYGIIGRRLYRAATSSEGTSFLLVADETVLPVGVNTYTDTLTDAELGVVLPSDGWELPPVNGKSIISLPNGMTALISNNQVCISPIGFAHTFPENTIGGATYRYPTDTPGVALGNIDSTLIALTQGFPYISSGLDPTTFGMGKLEKSYGCVSARSRVYLRQFGVVYASYTGIMAINGAGLRNLTQAYFDQDAWDFVNPSSIVASTKDDRVFGFCLCLDGTRRGFVFDPKEEGQAWTWFDLSANLDWNQDPAEGYFIDDISGNTYMVRGPALDSRLEIFDATAGSLSPQYLVQTWQSKIFRQPMTTAMNYARVKPRSGYNPNTAPLTFTYYQDGTLVTTQTVLNRQAFALGSYSGEDVVVQIKGAWPCEEISAAEDVEQLS